MSDFVLTVRHEGSIVGQKVLGSVPVVIGRSAPADIVLNAAFVSRRHCEAVLRDGAVWFTDLDSTNGIYLNGARVAGSVTLPPGGRLTIGSFAIEVTWPLPAQGQLPHPGEPPPAMPPIPPADLPPPPPPPAPGGGLADARVSLASLRPTPWLDGPVRAEALSIEGHRAAGVLCGYRMISAVDFSMYLMAVRGQGHLALQQAMLLGRQLQQNTILGAESTKPAAVLTQLNERIAADPSAGLPFGLWYGSYDAATRILEYSGSGDVLACLMAPDRSALVQLESRHPDLGENPGLAMRSARVRVRPGCTLYLVGPGAFDLFCPDGTIWGRDDLLAALSAPPVPGLSEARRLINAVRSATQRDVPDDDITIAVLDFP